MPRQDPRIKSITGDDGRVKCYEIRVSAQKPSGERYQIKRRLDTYQQAKAALDKLEGQKSAGTIIERSRETVAELLREWMASNEKHDNWTPCTIESYSRSVEKEIIPIIGAVSVQKLTYSVLQDFHDELLARKRDQGRKGVRTVRIAHQCLLGALSDAVQRGIITTNAVERVKLPRNDKAEQKTWTPEQTRHFLSVAARSAYGPLWIIVAATGMRRGEVLGLRWCDVDFDAGTISVRQTVVDVRGKPYIKATPKTRAGQRTIPIQTIILDELRAHRTAQKVRRVAVGEDWNDHGLVFAANNGNPISPRNAAREYTRLVKESGLPYIRIHDQRHSFASSAIEGGADIKAVSEILGHTDVRTTLNIYAHTSRKQHEDVTARVGKALFGS